MIKSPAPSWGHLIRCVLWAALAIQCVGALMLLCPLWSVWTIVLSALRGALAGMVPGLLIRNPRVFLTGAVAGAVADVGLRWGIHAVGPRFLFEWNSRGAANWELNQFVPPTHYGWSSRPNRSRFTFGEIFPLIHAVWLVLIGVVSFACVPVLRRWWLRIIAALASAGAVAFVLAFTAAEAAPKVGMRSFEEGWSDVVAALLALITVPAGLMMLWIWFPNRLVSPQAMGRCPRCDYDLRGSISPSCPECGATIHRLKPM